jgi:hypothetical protein
MVKTTPGASKPDPKTGNKVSPDQRTSTGGTSPHAGHGHGSDEPGHGKPKPPRPSPK